MYSIVSWASNRWLGRELKVLELCKIYQLLNFIHSFTETGKISKKSYQWWQTINLKKNSNLVGQLHISFQIHELIKKCIVMCCSKSCSSKHATVLQSLLRTVEYRLLIALNKKKNCPELLDFKKHFPELASEETIWVLVHLFRHMIQSVKQINS